MELQTVPTNSKDRNAKGMDFVMWPEINRYNSVEKQADLNSSFHL